jgi:hypothetical protein
MMALGMPNSSGMFAAGALAASSAALHASFAAAHGAGAVGAFGAGMALSGAGVSGFTREYTERRVESDQTGLPGLSRMRGGSRDGRGDGGGISGRAGGSMTDAASEAFVVNISYAAGAIAPADERRAAQTVARVVRRQSIFDRRTMGG